MKAIIETIDTTDEGKVIATRLTDEWFLFVSDYDNKKYWVNPSVVEILE